LLHPNNAWETVSNGSNNIGLVIASGQNEKKIMMFEERFDASCSCRVRVEWIVSNVTPLALN
jgi:hypothetical protein